MLALCCHVQNIAAVDAIPAGTALFQQDWSPLEYASADETSMRDFLKHYQGRGVVCTTMDKSANTLVFRCRKMYVNDVLHDFGSGSVYAGVQETPAQLINSHNTFLSRFKYPSILTRRIYHLHTGSNNRRGRERESRTSAEPHLTQVSPS